MDSTRSCGGGDVWSPVSSDQVGSDFEEELGLKSDMSRLGATQLYVQKWHAVLHRRVRKISTGTLPEGLTIDTQPVSA
jgi:hypothetical protein